MSGHGDDRIDGCVLPLLPCPFCGGIGSGCERVLRDGMNDGEADAWAYFIRCRSCAAEGGWAKSEAGARRRWNMRTPAPSADGY